MVSPATFPRGLGQLEAYTGVKEGVTFEMNNGEFWDSEGRSCGLNITGARGKRRNTKFWVTLLPSGKVGLRNWVGLSLAPVNVQPNPETFPIQTVRYSEDPALQFDVFFSGPLITFRAYNGLFLSSISNGITLLEAAKFFADFSCTFRPYIGDLTPPAFKILSVTPTDFSGVKCCRQFLKQEAYVNRREEPVRHTFVMTWRTQSTDRIVWNNLWGLGVPSSCRFKVKQANPIAVYTERNEQAASVIRPIFEWQRKEVEVPPKTSATARLHVYKHNSAVVPFIAVVRKTHTTGQVEIFNEAGAWKGLAYHDLQIVIKLKRLTP